MTIDIWVFGYGSLIWRPGFEYVESRLATVMGYQRSFSQASHDHRGTPEAPGRVVTLSNVNGNQCQGMAFRLGGDASKTLEALDVREQDGYERVDVSMVFSDGEVCDGITWIAKKGNPSWREGESLTSVARIIATSQGPSGTNREYLFELDRALTDRNIADEHVSELAGEVRSVLLGRR